MLKLQIEAKTPAAIDRLMKALAAALTPRELTAFQKKMEKELSRLKKMERTNS